VIVFDPSGSVVLHTKWPLETAELEPEPQVRVVLPFRVKVTVPPLTVVAGFVASVTVAVSPSWLFAPEVNSGLNVEVMESDVAVASAAVGVRCSVQEETEPPAVPNSVYT
jgi:hypothetical protein